MHIACPIHNEFMYTFLNKFQETEIEIQVNIIEFQGDKIEFREMKMNFREIK